MESFGSILDQCTNNYECLVIHNNAKSNSIQDMCFWYKAETHPDFKLGGKEYWDMSKGLDSDDDEEAYDPSKTTKRLKGPPINVKKFT